MNSYHSRTLRHKLDRSAAIMRTLMPLLIKGSLLTICMSLVVSCGQANTVKHQDLLRIKAEQTSPSAPNAAKKIILIVADSLLSEAIDRGLSKHQLPTIQALIERGRYERNVISSFPTMSVTIDSSLITGTYPDRHKVPGLIWYSDQAKRLINYGTGPSESLHQGAKRVIEDGMLHLNEEHLSKQVSTIYEDLHRKGKSSGSINGLLYRGPVQHRLAFPAWLEKPLNLPETATIKGPDLFAFGAFSNPLEDKLKLPVGPTNRFGLNNEYGIELTSHLAHNRMLPDFLYVYLPDADQQLHKHGPADDEAALKLDQQLGSLMQQGFGSVDEALKQAVIVIIGDSGVSEVRERSNDAKIELDKHLAAYKHLPPGQAPDSSTEIAIASNETMAYVYRFAQGPALSQLAAELASDARIDQLAWKDGDSVHVLQAGTGRMLHFKQGGPWQDAYQQAWTIEGDLEVMDLQTDAAHHMLASYRYPDGLKRLYAALHSHTGEYLIVTAKPGYELADEHSPTHPGGGAHGSLHAIESNVPIIVAGTQKLPVPLRIVDLKAWLLELSHSTN